MEKLSIKIPANSLYIKSLRLFAASLASDLGFNIEEVEDIIASFIFMLEDTRIDRDIRKQYLETCKPLKEKFFVRIDK